MKITRTTISLTLTILFVIFISVFWVFGKDMREHYSPKVTYTSMYLMEIDGRSYFTLPVRAVHRDDSGEAYIWAIQEDDTYGERRDAVHKYIIQVIYESDEHAAVTTMHEFLYDAKIAVDFDRELNDDEKVVITGRAEIEKEG